jgi:hypothetical protein
LPEYWRLKDHKRVARRCEKIAGNFASIVVFATGLCSIKVACTAQMKNWIRRGSLARPAPFQKIMRVIVGRLARMVT